MKSTISVYTYSDYRDYLKDVISVHKKGLSLSNLARKSQKFSKSYLSMVINGRRNLSSSKTVYLGQVLGLKSRELSFFETLVKFNQAATLNEKAFFLDQINIIKPKRVSPVLDTQHFEVLENWHALVIREMMRLPDFIEDPKWIVDRLEKRVSESDVRLALKRLQLSKIVARDKDGKLKPSSELLTTSDEVNSIYVQKYHSSCARLAQRILEEESLQKREFASINKTLSESQFKLLKQKIKNFRDEILDLVSDDTQNEGVYQINIQLLNLCKPGGSQ